MTMELEIEQEHGSILVSSIELEIIIKANKFLTFLKTLSAYILKSFYYEKLNQIKLQEVGNHNASISITT